MYSENGTSGLTNIISFIRIYDSNIRYGSMLGPKVGHRPSKSEPGSLHFLQNLGSG